MAKITWKPGTMEYPLPPVMVSCGSMEKPNVMTAAWTGIVSSDPAMTYVSIRPSRYSHELIKESGEFVINLTTLPLVTAARLLRRQIRPRHRQIQGNESDARRLLAGFLPADYGKPGFNRVQSGQRHQLRQSRHVPGGNCRRQRRRQIS